MEKHLTIFLFILISVYGFSQHSVNLYLFPGQGSDYRIFSEFTFPFNYKITYMNYHMPEKDETLKQYAYSFINNIDTSQAVVLIGVSLGGMICTELADTLKTHKLILISSAKCRNELPARYRFQSAVPINEAVPEDVVKEGALILQPIVEPDRNNNQETFKNMLESKDPTYLKRTADMIINWDRVTYNPKIIHIHGNNDHTLPHRNIKYDYLIEGGSHMMALTRGKEINKLVNSILNDNDK